MVNLLIITSTHTYILSLGKYFPSLSYPSPLLPPTFQIIEKNTTFLKKPSDTLQSDLDVPPLYSHYFLGRFNKSAGSPVSLPYLCVNSLKTVIIIGSSLYTQDLARCLDHSRYSQYS